MKPDIIAVDPKTIDYPIFTKQVEKYREYFNKVIIISTAELRGGDWRDVATNKGLFESTSDWVLFLEQDFFFTKFFLLAVRAEVKNYDAIGFWEANRLHPAFLLVKREWIEKTSKDFDPIYEEKLDHFGRFSKELVQEGAKIGELEKDLGLKLREDFYHMQGLTHNHNLYRDKNFAPIFKRHEFQTYCKYAGIDVNELGEFEEVEWLKKFLV